MLGDLPWCVVGWCNLYGRDAIYRVFCCFIFLFFLSPIQRRDKSPSLHGVGMPVREFCNVSMPYSSGGYCNSLILGIDDDSYVSMPYSSGGYCNCLVCHASTLLNRLNALFIRRVLQSCGKKLTF